MEEATRALAAANEERGEATRVVDELELQEHAAEAAARSAGKEPPPRSEDYRNAIRRKITAIEQYWKALDHYNQVRSNLPTPGGGSAAGSGAEVLVGAGALNGAY